MTTLIKLEGINKSHTNSDERYLQEALDKLRVDYENACKPLIDALVRIECAKTGPRMMVTIEQARSMGFDVPNAPIEGRGGRHSQETSDAQPASPPMPG